MRSYGRRAVSRAGGVRRALGLVLGIGTAAGLGACQEGGDDVPADRAGGDTAVPAPIGARVQAAGKRAYQDGEILVRWKSGTGAFAQATLHEAEGAVVRHSFRLPARLQLVEIGKGKSVEEAVARYRADPDVLYAEPNYVYELDVVPSDPMLDQLWGMHNSGQTGGTAGADINAPEAWDTITGSAETIVGTIDTGIAYAHPDLAANVWVNPAEIAGNDVDDDGNGYVDDMHGINAMDGSGDPDDELDHGSHVGGTIAGVGNNGVGVVGVNWQARLIACKAFSPVGGTLDAILRCMDYYLALKTRAENPVDIVATNNSWGGGFSQALYDAIAAHGQAGMLFVAAAGNDFGRDTDVDPHYPSAYDLPNIVSVMATDHDDQRAEFSNLGRRTVDIAAPGVDVVSTVTGNGYAAFSGTSMATPHVTGLAALLKSQDPGRNWQTIKNLILTGGQPIAAAATTTLSGRRLRAWGEGGTGSVNCSGQVLYSRFAPAQDVSFVGSGDSVALGVLSIECGGPSTGPQSVAVVETGETVALVDPGSTGEFSARWTPPGTGAYTLQFSGGDTVTVNVLASYDRAEEVAMERRVFEGTDLGLSDDGSALIELPFAIPFAGSDSGPTSLYVGGNGTLSFSSTGSPYSNEGLPTGMFDTLIAPMWDDLNPSAGGSVRWEILGAAPQRELVVEWRDVPHYSNIGAATFQVVLFEDRSDVLFNYVDVGFDSADFDGGASATVGIQVVPGVAVQHSLNQAVLRDGMALLWRQGAPRAVAGPDQVVLPGAAVSLDGSRSSDSDGRIVSYRWTQVAGEPVTLAGADTAHASFTAPDPSGTLSFNLEVVDDEGKRSSDQVNVVVNRPPVAQAGSNFRAGTGVRTALDGTGSSDPDGEIVGYRWTQLDGTPVTLEQAETARPHFMAPASPDHLVFQLTVVDEYGSSDSDVMVVELFHNDAPIASAGGHRVVRPGSAVTLDGSASRDPDGSIAAYQWQVDGCTTLLGGCEVALAGADSASPSFTAPAVPAILQLTLTVTDNVGGQTSDTITVTAAWQAPRAHIAGPALVTTGASVLLQGIASRDPDGSIAAYRWQQIGGPAVSLTGATEPEVSFTAPADSATLRFRLTVQDEDGLVHQVEFDVAVHRPPHAVADSDNTTVVAGQLVTLDGSSSRATGAPGYAWVQVAGRPVVLSDAVAAMPTFVAAAPQGESEILRFRLQVTDSLGFADDDVVTVVVFHNLVSRR